MTGERLQSIFRLITMRRRAFLASPLLLLAAAARGAEPYPEVTAGHPLQFPRDYGSHPGFRNEWWYVTGWLEDTSGHVAGFQVTFFRHRPGVAEDNPSRFAAHELLFAHGATGDATVTGTAWLDHEWSSEYMAADALGWDWIGINLDDGGALMAFRMRDRSGAAFWAGGSHRTPDGRVRSFAPAEIRFTPQRRWRSPRTQVDYPVAMNVRAGDVECVLEPLMDDQELDARTGIGTIYWEGAVRAFSAGRVIGRGYLELTGYGKPLKL